MASFLVKALSDLCFIDHPTLLMRQDMVCGFMMPNYFPSILFGGPHSLECLLFNAYNGF